MLAQQASASELVYQPINPAFGGNPFNGPFLLETATLQNGHEPNDKGTGGSGLTGLSGLSDQDQFVKYPAEPAPERHGLEGGGRDLRRERAG